MGRERSGQPLHSLQQGAARPRTTPRPGASRLAVLEKDLDAAVFGRIRIAWILQLSIG
jgi:hypothetical protein